MSTVQKPGIGVKIVSYESIDFLNKSKTSKLADHQPYDLKITLDEGTSLPFGPIYSLWLCISSLTRTSLQGSSIPLAPPMGLWFFSSRRKMALFNFASTSEASTESPGKTDTHFRSFLTPQMHQEKHESTPKLTSSMHTILSGLCLEMNGRLHSEPFTVPQSGR